MTIIAQLSSIIFNARSSEDAAVLVIDYLNSIGSSIKVDKIDTDSRALSLFPLILERARHSEPLLRNVLAISIAKDIENHVDSVTMARTLLELLYYSGIDVSPQFFSRTELEYIGKLVKSYNNDFNLAATAFIDFMDKEGAEISEGGHLENDKDFYFYLTGVNT